MLIIRYEYNMLVLNTSHCQYPIKINILLLKVVQRLNVLIADTYVMCLYNTRVFLHKNIDWSVKSLTNNNTLCILYNYIYFFTNISVGLYI